MRSLKNFLLLCWDWWLICPVARLTELLGVITNGWWVFLIAQPGDLFATNPAFQGLDAHGGEPVWGAILAVALALQLSAFLFGAPLLRFIALGVGAGVWGGVASLLATASPVTKGGIVLNTGLGVYSGMVIVDTVAATLLVQYAILDAEGIGRHLRRRFLRQRQQRQQRVN